MQDDGDDHQEEDLTASTIIMREANLKIDKMNAQNEADSRFVSADKELYNIR